jgi:hypothetical protein
MPGVGSSHKAECRWRSFRYLPHPWDYRRISKQSPEDGSLAPKPTERLLRNSSVKLPTAPGFRSFDADRPFPRMGPLSSSYATGWDESAGTSIKSLHPKPRNVNVAPGSARRNLHPERQVVMPRDDVADRVRHRARAAEMVPAQKFSLRSGPDVR